jgi:hypothetical protein
MAAQQTDLKTTGDEWGSFGKAISGEFARDAEAARKELGDTRFRLEQVTQAASDAGDMVEVMVNNQWVPMTKAGARAFLGLSEEVATQAGLMREAATEAITDMADTADEKFGEIESAGTGAMDAVASHTDTKMAETRDRTKNWLDRIKDEWLMFADAMIYNSIVPDMNAAILENYEETYSEIEKLSKVTFAQVADDANQALDKVQAIRAEVAALDGLVSTVTINVVQNGGLNIGVTSGVDGGLTVSSDALQQPTGLVIPGLSNAKSPPTPRSIPNSQALPGVPGGEKGTPEYWLSFRDPEGYRLYHEDGSLTQAGYMFYGQTNPYQADCPGGT